MSKGKMEKPLRTMNRYMEQMDRISRLTGIASRLNIATMFETPISRLLQQQDYIANLFKSTEFTSAFSYAEKIEKLVLPNAAVFSEVQRALDIVNTPAIREAILYANRIEGIMPKRLGSMFENSIAILERINFNNSRLSFIIDSLNTYQNLFQNIINTTAYNNLLGNLFPEDEYSQIFNNFDSEIDEVSLTSIEEEELANDITEIYSSPNWQQRLNAAIIKWQEKNPIVMRVLQAIVTIITIISAIVTIAGFVHQATIVSDKAAIRKEPSKAAPIVYTVTKNEIVTIISEERYWYQVEYVPLKFEDEDKKTVYRGYIAKRTTVKTIETKSTSAAEDDGLE
ncbi:MAG: SH3 domain-containing protein [Bacillota bacterium]